jgi:hypothetical protein
MKGTTMNRPQAGKAAGTGRGVASADTRRAQSAEAKAKMIQAGLAGGAKKEPAKPKKG